MTSIRFCAWNPLWSNSYNEEALRLGGHVARWAAPGGLHHIGATAVRDLSARPIIDILLETDGAVPATPLDLTLVRAGYELDDHLAFASYFPVRFSPGNGPLDISFQLHVAPRGSMYVRRVLAFRDALATNPVLALAYDELRKSASASAYDNPDKYRRTKAAFIDRAL